MQITELEFTGGEMMPEPVTIPTAFFEFTSDFEHPAFTLWIDRADVIQAVFDALMQWNPRVDDMEGITTGKTSEQGFAIKLPLKGVSFFFGPASCRFTRDNIHWQVAEETIAILDAAISALTSSAGVVLGAKNVALGMHLQPKSVPFTTLLLPFIAPQLVSLDSKPMTSAATVVKWADCKVTVDGSASIANALFLKIERQFPSTASYVEIAKRMKEDQDNLFRILGVEEDQG